MQSDSTQRLPLLSQAEGEDMDFHSDSDEPLQFFDTEKFTVREKLLGFASIMLLTGLLVFAYLYQQVGGGHHHGGMNMAALDKPLCTSDTCILAAADMLQTMNTSANPCHEFHNYACGSVDSNRKDPTAQSVFKYLGQLLLTWNTTVFTDDADQESFEMLDKFYKSCIDRNPSNLSSLEAMITKLEAIMVTEDASDSVAFPTKTLGYLASNAIFPLFRLDVEQDIRNVTSYSLDISQSGLSLPSLLDYESNDAKTAFNSNIKRVLQIITKYGIQVLRNDSLEQFAEQVVATETALASISKSPDELYLESISKMQYHSSDLQSLVSAINWPEYFTTAIESKTIDLVYVRSADYLGNLQKLLSAGNLSNLKAYFTFQVLLAHANELPAEALHAMRSVNSNLVQDEADSCLIKTNDVFGNLIGHYFPEASQDQVVFIGQLYDDIRRALAKNIPKFGWMDRMAIGHALHKLDHMTLEISHPINHTAGSPVHYQTLPITNDYVQNTITARKWKLQSSFDLLDTNDAVINWPVLPQDIGMVYQPIGNKLIVPAGVLHGYPMTKPNYIMYGQLGVQLANQVIRAVDAVGSNFNSTGNLNNWWTAITKDSYSVRRQCLVSETSETQSLDSILRYQAAIQLAYRAWIYRLEENKGSPVDVLPGQLYDLGPEQLLYITGAQGQCHHPPSWLNIASQRDRGFLRVHQCKNREQYSSCPNIWA